MVVAINDQVSSNYFIINAIIAKGIKIYNSIFYEFLSFFESIFKKDRFSVWKKGFSYGHKYLQNEFLRL